MGFSIQMTSYLAASWWPSSLHSVSLEAWWHARNKALIATLLPKHREGSRGPRAHVMALTGPGDSTVTVKEPAGSARCSCQTAGEGTQAAQTPGRLLIDVHLSHARPYANTQWRHAWQRAVHARAKWNNVILAVVWQVHTRTHVYIKHTHNLVGPLGAPDSSALSFQSVSGSSKHPVQLLFLADCTCTT